MGKLGDLDVHITVKNSKTDEDTCLEEYPDPNHRAHETKTTNYIAIAPNKTWCVSIHIPIIYVFLSDVLIFHISVNGILAAQTWRRPDKHERSPRHPSSAGLVLNEQDPIKESITPTIDDEPVRFPVFSMTTRNLGVKPTDEDIKTWENHKIVVKVTHGKLIHTPELNDTWNEAADYQVQPIDDTAHELTFTFLPRPAAILRYMLPNPPPSLSVSTSPNDCPSEIQSMRDHPANQLYRDSLRQSKSNELYCYCRKITAGPVVTCDNDDCEIKWYHQYCVGLKEQPRKWPWLCSDCREWPAELLKMEGKVDGV